MKNYNVNIYCDMDGVLANFSRKVRAVERFENEKGFFKNLAPIKTNVESIKLLIENNYNVYILSASPNESADNDKIEWLKKYLPMIKNENIILMRNGENKADFVKTNENNLLFDDYSKNVNDFLNRGFDSVKIEKYFTIKRYIKIIGLL